jgi:SAM-dependent methyltransferase
MSGWRRMIARWLDAGGAGPSAGGNAGDRGGTERDPLATDAAGRQRLYDEFRRLLVEEMFELTTEARHPNTSRFNESFRTLPALHWNVKALGADLAARHYSEVAASRRPLRDDPFPVNWRPTRFGDYTQKWFLETCRALRLAPALHRKLWEEAFVVNTLERSGKLTPGSRGIVFGVGQERLPAYFASLGAGILATDLPPDDASAREWVRTSQHGSLDRLFFPEYLDKESFSAAVRFRCVDMNDIPGDLDGGFDFCWSICAFEHLGSIERGLAFVERSGALLAPGGVAVHTTEFNYASEERTIDHWPTVLFRKKDFERLAGRLTALGYDVPPVEFHVGSTPVDFFIDVPPYPQHKETYYQTELGSLHLKLMIDGFPATCYGLSFRKT